MGDLGSDRRAMGFTPEMPDRYGPRSGADQRRGPNTGPPDHRVPQVEPQNRPGPPSEHQYGPGYFGPHYGPWSFWHPYAYHQSPNDSQNGPNSYYPRPYGPFQGPYAYGSENFEMKPEDGFNGKWPDHRIHCPMSRWRTRPITYMDSEEPKMDFLW